MVWHHRRGTLRAYLRQQAGYGEAEFLLDRKWQVGEQSARRSGRVYGAGHGTSISLFRSRIYHGVWGNAPFQAVYAQSSRVDAFIMSAVYVATASLLLLSLVGLLWPPLRVATPLLVIGVAAIVAHAFINARKPAAGAALAAGGQRWKWIAITTILHTMQPIARFAGRMRGQWQFIRPANLGMER